MNLRLLLESAVAIQSETSIGGITPDRIGGVLVGTLRLLNAYQLASGNLSLQKIYLSVDSMMSDSDPISDLTGRSLKAGQLVVVASGDDSAGNVYRYDGIEEGVSQWTLISKIGGIPADTELDSTSTNPIANATVTRELTHLRELINSIPETGGGSGGSSGGTSIDPELLEAYMPMSRDFSDDFNNDFAR